MGRASVTQWVLKYRVAYQPANGDEWVFVTDGNGAIKVLPRKHFNITIPNDSSHAGHPVVCIFILINKINAEKCL